MTSLLRLLALPAFIGIALVGCSSTAPQTPSVSVTAEMDDARAALSRAQEVGAETSAPTEYRAAASRLAEAQATLDAGNSAHAARLAREAAVDARLAEASVLAARARARLALRAEVDRLRSEIGTQN